jgi:hypothetical protein
MFSPLNGLLLILLAEVSGCVPWRGSLLIEESAVLKQDKFNKKHPKICCPERQQSYHRVETRKTGQLNIYRNTAVEGKFMLSGNPVLKENKILTKAIRHVTTEISTPHRSE